MPSPPTHPTPPHPAPSTHPQRHRFTRYKALAFVNTDPAPTVEPPTINGITVTVATTTTELGPDMDESYTLDVSHSDKSGQVQLKSNTVFGALRGLETFAQLLSQVPTAKKPYKELVMNETSIKDSPRFGFRASFIDTCRHWYPLSVIKEHIDIMSYAKFNVLHWHIVDSQSFPYVSKAFPQLSASGAWSPTHIYTPKDVQEVISYAADRGIRILPEFDTPGHMQQGYAAIPNLLTQCYGADGKPSGTGPANPTLDSTYDRSLSLICFTCTCSFNSRSI